MNIKKYRITLFFIVFFLFLIGIFVGLEFTKKDIASNEKNDDNINKVIKIYDDIAKPVLNQNLMDITVNTDIYYLVCKETISEEKVEYSTTSDKVKEKYKKFKIKDEGKNYIKFVMEIDSNCPNHFLIKTLKDNVVIYKVINNEKIELYKNTEIPIKTVRQEIVEQLKDGIKVNSIKELNQIIEDIES